MGRTKVSNLKTRSPKEAEFEVFLRNDSINPKDKTAKKMKTASRVGNPKPVWRTENHWGPYPILGLYLLSRARCPGDPAAFGGPEMEQRAPLSFPGRIKLTW